jgi:hypothetical protein
MQKILKITVLLFISISVFSQDFEVGSYIKNGKKIEGYIKYYDWIKSPKSIEFKANLESPVVIVEAQDVEGFSVHGEDFIAQLVSISLSPTGVKTDDKPYKHKIEDGYFFLHVLIKTAGISLYEMNDSKKEPHFFVEKEGKIQELFYTKYTVNYRGNNYFQEQKGYIGQLSVLMADCEKMVIPQELGYTTNNLLALCKSYLACKGMNISVAKSIKKEVINFSVGFNAGKILNQDEHFNWSSGLVVRMNFPRHFRNQYIQVEFNHFNIYDSRLQNRINVDGLLNRAAFGVLVGSHFGNKNLRPFVNVGMIVPLINNIGSNKEKLSNNLIIGVGFSWKRSFKIEYRDNPSGLFRQISLGYLYNFSYCAKSREKLLS